MSLTAMVWALEHAPVDDQGALLVLIALAERADEHGRQAYPGKPWLAGRARCSERTVQRHLRTLREAGLIAEGDQRAVAHYRQDRRPVVYDLNLRMTRGDSLTPQGLAHGETPEDATGSQDAYERGDTGDSQTVLTLVTVQENPPTAAPPREDVERLCSHLADRLEQRGRKRPTITARWRTDMRLLLDVDGRTEDKVHKAIDWSADDEFWGGVILSAGKLRKHYDTLRERATRSGSRDRHAGDPSTWSGFFGEGAAQ